MIVCGVGTTRFDFGEGITSFVVVVNGALWGSGEISIGSMPGAGDDDGIGGVVIPSNLTGGVIVPS